MQSSLITVHPLFDTQIQVFKRVVQYSPLVQVVKVVIQVVQLIRVIQMVKW